MITKLTNLFKEKKRKSTFEKRRKSDDYFWENAHDVILKDHNIDPTLYESISFKAEIVTFIKKGYDLSLILNPKFTWLQVVCIRKGLDAGIDVSGYAFPDMHYTEMKRYLVSQNIKF